MIGLYGLSNRPAASSTSSVQWDDWTAQISAAADSEPELYTSTLQLIDYCEKTNQLPKLEDFANTLPLHNDVAFERLSLYLMARYRRLGKPAESQRVRAQLLDQRGQNPQIANRVTFFDVSEHLTHVPPGGQPSADDRERLLSVAGSGTDFAPVACATLRYFYPGCGCSTGSNGRQSRPAAAQRQLAAAPLRAPRPAVVRAYPNPAQAQVTLEARDLAVVRVQLVAVVTGQVALAQAVTGPDRFTLSVAGLAPGVYRGLLLDAAGQTVGTSKIVVLH